MQNNIMNPSIFYLTSTINILQVLFYLQLLVPNPLFLQTFR